MLNILKSKFLFLACIVTTASCSVINENNQLENQKETSFSIKATNVDKAWIPVPFQSQFDTGAASNNWCCGLASINMGTAYLNGKQPTSDYLKKMYTLLGKTSGCKAKDGTYGTNSDDQLRVAKEVGNAKNSYNTNLSYDGLKSEIKRGNPVVVGLKYSFIKNKCASFSGYHSVIVIGYNSQGGYWVVNDPLCKSSSSGLNKQIPSQEFRDATLSWTKEYGYSSGVFGTVLKK